MPYVLELDLTDPHLVEALHLQRAPRDGEVDHGHPRADVRPELDGGVARRQEDRERGREVDVLKVGQVY